MGVMVCGCPLVRDVNNQRLPGFYDSMMQSEHAKFMGTIASQVQWGAECINNNLSAGKIVSVEPSERGAIVMVDNRAGPSQ